MMTGNPPEADYDDPMYDALWEAAVDLELPLSIDEVRHPAGIGFCADHFQLRMPLKDATKDEGAHDVLTAAHNAQEAVDFRAALLQ